MSTGTLSIIIVAVAVLIAAGLVTWLIVIKRRSQNLRQKFGPEYDFTLEKVGEQRAAEETLFEREKRVDQLSIRDLNSDEALRYQTDWSEIQADFVDNPPGSIEEANRLITEVMIARGFPVANFEQRAADLSVLYPHLISDYRKANAIALKNQDGGASTEELRQAMVCYHSLFGELVGNTEEQPDQSIEKEAVTQ